ncbi:MAG TPA: MBL fold metallo-hydrolase [Humidesulfovibrio sp.]|uniref:MBL fold metallo-hydrolase n=1 Tax=Humidesulfovibrio sp. TaxID=2910988 RepID=UPI002C2D0E68|nr:MBL fold metallo-hydrolase [Humidesulfovibrio sp.]HWR03678.1 MBL fold metallo-hydrolase [Humidesulfovibrio sp.]
MNQLDILSIPRGGLPPLHPVLLRDETEMVLVDCGCTGFLPLLEEAFRAVGADMARLTRVFITHHDHDHMGALAALKRSRPGVQVLASAEDAPHIAGERKSLRLIQAEALQQSLPDDKKEEGLGFMRLLAGVEPAHVDAQLRGDELFPWCGGIEVIATPGHMPGHISLYARASRTLIAGDAMVVQDGRLCVANPQYTLDMPEARRSLARLLSYDIQHVVCYHGGAFAGDIPAALRKGAGN